MIQKIGKNLSLKADSVYLFNSEYQTDVMYGEKVILSVTDQDALWLNTEREKLAKEYQSVVNNKILELKRNTVYFRLPNGLPCSSWYWSSNISCSN